MKKRRRNTQAFTFMAWTSFVLALSFIIVGIYNAGWPLVEKGYYAGSMLWAISAAFVLAKVIRDNEEDREVELLEKFDQAKKTEDKE